jgi:Polyketide cyclase / dehydrase and lipid transport
MTQVSCQTTINSPADAIWQVISDLHAACHYLAMVVNCAVEGAGVGARRTLTSVDGSTIVERLELLDQAAHRLSYALLTDTPFRNCVTTMTLRDLGSSQCELEWSATFDTDGLPASEAAELMENALAANCLALKQFMENGRK